MDVHFYPELYSLSARGMVEVITDLRIPCKFTKKMNTPLTFSRENRLFRMAIRQETGVATVTWHSAQTK